MAGKIHELIKQLIEKKAGGNSALMSSIKVKIIMKGVLVDKYDENSEDDPLIIEKVKNIASEMGVVL